MSKKIIVNVRVREDGKEWEETPSKNIEFASEKQRSEFVWGLSVWTNKEVRWEYRDSLTDTQTGCNSNGHYIVARSDYMRSSPIINP